MTPCPTSPLAAGLPEWRGLGRGGTGPGPKGYATELQTNPNLVSGRQKYTVYTYVYTYICMDIYIYTYYVSMYIFWYMYIYTYVYIDIGRRYARFLYQESYLWFCADTFYSFTCTFRVLLTVFTACTALATMGVDVAFTMDVRGCC